MERFRIITTLLVIYVLVRQLNVHSFVRQLLGALEFLEMIITLLYMEIFMIMSHTFSLLRAH